MCRCWSISYTFLFPLHFNEVAKYHWLFKILFVIPFIHCIHCCNKAIVELEWRTAEMIKRLEFLLYEEIFRVF